MEVNSRGATLACTTDPSLMSPQMSWQAPRFTACVFASGGGALNKLWRPFLLLVLFSLVISVAGCGGGGNQSIPNPNPNPNPSAPPPSGGPNVAYLTQITGTGNYQINLMSNTGVTPVGWPDMFNYVYLSSDGKKIVYSLSDGNSFWIGIMNSDGSGQRTLTTTGFSFYPQFTPDGSKIIYQYWPGPHYYSDIVLMDADGTNPQNLTNQNGKNYWEPTVSPDGKTIAAVVNGGLATMNIDGSGLQVIQTGGVFLGEPTFSGDGTKIFFSYILGPYYPDNSNIYVVNVDGTNLTQLTNSSYDWCPVVVGNKVLFISTRDSQTHNVPDNEIYNMNSDGSGITRLTNDKDNDTFIGYPMFGIPG
jgi:Tol biopolymer transport system component